MKKFLFIFILIHSLTAFSTNIYDVYQQQSYRYNLRVFTEELKADYLPSKMELTQAKIENTNADILRTEEKFKATILATVTNEFQYFKLQTLFKEQLKRLNQYYLLKQQNGDYDQFYEATSTNQLKSIEIELLSIVNGFATYQVRYEMEIKTTNRYRTIWNEDVLSKYYIVELKTGKTQQIEPLTSVQQQIVKASAEAKLNKLYLLQTQKIKLSEIERVRNIEKEDNISFEQKIDMSEAVVYPYFSGVLVTFPSFTKSAELFENEPFRVFISAKEMPLFYGSFPWYKEIFNVPIQPVHQEIIQQLTEEKNFDLSIFRTAPKSLALIPYITQKPLRTLSITDYKISNDSISDLIRTQTYYFNLNQTLNRYDERDKNRKIVAEDNYFYNANDQLITKISKEKDEVEIYYYERNHLGGKENYRVNIDYRFPKTEMEANEEVYFYIANYRYSLNYPMVGKFDSNRSYNSVLYRKIDKNSNCSSYQCFVLDDKKRIIGLEKNSNELVDVLTDSLGRPKEAYFDNGRENYFFEYDQEGRIIQYRYLHDKKVIHDMKYQYLDEKTIKITNTQAPQLQEYKVEFW